MPAALNIQPLKAPDLGGIVVHEFREYTPESVPCQVDPERSHLNELLCGDRRALDELPTHQPDTGRKIRTDANRVASFICTLPKELDPQQVEHVRQWADTTTQWL